ncbi:hypothetical protein MMYC01_203848 [Madurella mycetomatis]|uniref:Uncharacterized protein n=1 Tax=Madurella mycetomatis TaxID=100816 RepID=A0A175W798_9PEZI|nr:hypothetical protein MMYC01_203848 [Madurella mycetomatis]
MADHLVQPRLMGGVRRFGRYDNFKEFSRLSSGNASVGSKSMGKITIDCQFLFKQSRWGVLGDEEFPAGILYLNLNFGPPQSCRLKSATVTVTLDEEDPCLNRYKSAPGRNHSVYCPVQITDWYGPKQLVGEEKNIDRRHIKKLVPEINILGNGGGGLGVESETSFKQSGRWSFSGQLLPGKKTREYKTLRWELTENALETRPAHSNRIYTAFTFEHSGQPFLMKVDVEGRLDRWDKQAVYKLKFGGLSTRDNRVVTLIDFGDYSRFRQRLDEIARGLPRTMEMKNFEEIPVVVPSPISGTSFRAVASSDTQPEDQTLSAAPVSTADPSVAQSALYAGSRPLDPLGNSAHHLLSEGPTYQQSVPLDGDATAPTVENFARVLQALSNPMHEDTPMKAPSSPSMGDTVVNDEENAAGANQMPAQMKTQAKAFESVLDPHNVPDPETVVKVLRIPAILGVLRMLAMLMSLVGYLPTGDTTDGDRRVGSRGEGLDEKRTVGNQQKAT